jgi:hypothetical protein
LERVMAEQQAQAFGTAAPPEERFRLVSIVADNAPNAAAAAEATQVAVEGTALDVGDYLDALETDAYIIDDYAYWNAHGRVASAGKPIFPVSYSRRSPDGRSFQMGFDDNDCMYDASTVTSSSAKCTVCWQRINPVDPLRNKHFFLVESGSQMFRAAADAQQAIAEAIEEKE